MPLAQGDKALQCRVYAPVGSPARGGVLSFLIAAIDRRNAGRPDAFAWAAPLFFSFIRQGLARFPCGREHGAAERVFVGSSSCKKRAAFKREEQQCSD
jgi:hypothetical protein